MNLSNFKELINAKVLNESKLSKISGFSICLSKLSYANAFFTNDEEEAKKAAILGAYAIVSEKRLAIIDNDISYFQVDSIDIALKRLVKFLCVDKCAILVDKINLECFKRLNYKTLSSNLIDDFEILCSNDVLISCDKNYLDEIKLSYDVPKFSVELIKSSSFFYQDVNMNGEYYQNINVPRIFINSIALIHSLRFNINYTNLKLLDYIFFNDENEQVRMSEASKVVFFENNEIIINEIRKYLDLTKVDELKNYVFMLYTGDKEQFLKNNVIKEPKGLF